MPTFKPTYLTNAQEGLGACIAGARVKFLIHGQEVGWATGFQGQETLDIVPVQVLGEIDVVEHEVTGRTCNFSVAFCRLLLQPITSFATHFAGETWEDVVASGLLEAAIMDEAGPSPKVLYKFEKCIPTSRSFSVDRGGLMTVNATFVARRMRDELNE